MKLLYFAILRERLKKDQEELEFKGTISQLRQLLIEKYPELEPVLKVVRFAVNEEYVGDEYQLLKKGVADSIYPMEGGQPLSYFIKLALDNGVQMVACKQSLDLNGMKEEDLAYNFPVLTPTQALPTLGMTGRVLTW